MRKRLTAITLACGLLLTSTSAYRAESVTEAITEALTEDRTETGILIPGFAGVKWGASLEKAKSILVTSDMVEGTDYGTDAVGFGGWIALDVNGVALGGIETRASLLFFRDHLAYGEYYIPQSENETIEYLIEKYRAVYGEPSYYKDVDDSEYYDVYIWMDADENVVVFCDKPIYFTTDEDTLKLLRNAGVFKTINGETRVDILEVINTLKNADDNEGI